MALLEPIEMEPHERLIWARCRAGYSSASEAARNNKWNENTYRSHENGERGIRLDAAKRYAAAFGVRPEFILLGSSDLNFTSKLPLVGLVITKGVVTSESYIKEGNYKSIASLGVLANNHMLALEVDSDTNLGVARPGDLFIYWRINSYVDKSVDTIIDKLCFVSEVGRGQAISIIRIGSRPRSLIIELPNGVGEVDRDPDFIALVHAIIPAGQWQKEAAD